VSDETEWEKKNPGKPLPKGLKKGIERAERANQRSDEESKKSGKLKLGVIRGTKGQGNRRGGKK